MLNNWTILLVSFGYLGLLFAIAYYGDKQAERGRSIISNPYIYSLSLAVYCTAWTFYGSVGRAAGSGVGFLPIYIGPMLMAPLWWVVLRKIIRITKAQRITSIADFISSRYGKSSLLGGLVTIIAVLGVIPYISLQLKAISTSYTVLSLPPDVSSLTGFQKSAFLQDTTFYIAMILAVFSILFGTRHLDATERHEGLVAAIAFESVIKLVAFLTVGIFVTFGLYNGFTDLFTKSLALPQLRTLMTIGEGTGFDFDGWISLTFLSMLAIMFLPRQFQIAVIENVNENHINKAIWLFPLYLFLINIFVLPIAFAGSLHFPDGNVDADTFVLALPIVEGQGLLALFVFLGGLSAATGMVIVATIALSTMICNNLAMPILLKLKFLRLAERSDLTGLLLAIRRGSIIFLLLFAYTYFHFIAGFYSLVSIGLTSFAAVAQFAPAILGGIFWKGGTRHGALCGLIAGFIVWAYTLPFSDAVQAGLFPQSILDSGPYGISLLQPLQLFGLQGLDPISHGLFWSLLFNTSIYIYISMKSTKTAIEHNQSAMFVDVFKRSGVDSVSASWQRTVSMPDLYSLLKRLLGKKTAENALTAYAKNHGIDWKGNREADAGLVTFSEKLLAGTIGSASARVMVASVVKEEPLRIEEVMNILDETQQAIAYSKELEKKSKQLVKTTDELKAANEQLTELDRMKDDFIGTVTHELRTPLTSVRAFSEILHDNPNLDSEQRQKFLAIIIKETERLTRLISQVLDVQKIESGTMEWEISQVAIKEIIDDALAATSQLMEEKSIQCNIEIQEGLPPIMGDRDKLMQALLNLISNAVKFCDSERGQIIIKAHLRKSRLQVEVQDNGIGISKKDQKVVFEKFRQVSDMRAGKPAGSGLGLTITRKIIEHHKGDIKVISTPGKGATFLFTLPI